MAKRVKIGDVFRVKTSTGFGYVQYLYNDEEYGYLIRKISGNFITPVKDKDLVEISQSSTDFYVFFPLQTAVNESDKKILTKEGNLIEVKMYRGLEIPKNDISPLMLEGQKGNWSIRREGKKKYLGEILPESYKGMSIVRISNYESLIFKIDSDYKSQDDPAFK